MTLSAGTRIGPYEIIAPLDAGGMGEVYRARDPRIGREVAIKVLPASWSQDRERLQRFEQEARAAGALNHPALLTIHDFGEQNGAPYMVSELLEGETLRARLHGGPLSPRRAIEYAIQIAGGLAVAHGKGIIHRDIKPENIFITKDGRVKILDFGLAKLTDTSERPSDASTAVRQTQPGTVMGTAGYMSPEQVRGEEVDQRSDIFSLGTVLYECLAGTAPFRRDSSVETMNAILKEDPAEIASPGKQISPAVAKVVSRCLEKHREARYQSAADLAFHLEDVSDTSEPRGLRTGRSSTFEGIKLIVLPFRVLRPDPEFDFLADSLPDAITSSLGALTSLVVRSSLAGAPYAGVQSNPATIAQELDVNAIVSGTILSSGGRLRVTSQLTELPSARLLWSHSVETTLSNIFQLQDELTHKIVESLAVPLNSRDSEALRHDIPRSAVGYEFFLRANQQGHSPDAWLVARDLYEQSLREDPEFAPAWARLGRCQRLIAKYTAEPGDHWRAAEEAMQRALELNPDLALAHRVYAELELDLGRTLDALKRLGRAVRHRKNDPELYAALVHALRYCGLLDESLHAYQEARRLDPRAVTSVSHTYFMRGEYNNTVAAAERDIGYIVPLSLAMLNQTEEAIRRLRERLSELRDARYRAYLESLLFTLQDEPAHAIAALDFVTSNLRDPEALYYMVRSYAHLGETEKALDLLERIVVGFFCVPVLRSDPWLENVRQSQRFHDIIAATSERRAEAERLWRESSKDEQAPS